MGEALLATAGDTIKLWDASTYAFYQEINFENGHVNGLAWNQDGQCLASLGNSGEEIFLSAICGKSETNIGVVRGIKTPTCVKFACRCPHYLGVGSESGMVTVWNVKSQTKKKIFTPTDRAIAKIAFSYSDSHIAAATKKGALYMLSVVNNLAAGPYQLFNNQAVTDLTYSQVKKSLLGCCSEGGTISLYDTHANKVVHSFSSAHSSPVAAVCFSPVNELLMVSVGYDKMISCYNVQTRQPVISHRTAAPLTSVTFLGLGQLVALGTMTGQVMVHDMRNIRSPIATIRAHRSAVTSVLLQPCLKSKSVSSSKTGDGTNTEATLTVSKHKPSKSCSDQPTELSPDMRPKPESSSEDRKLDLNVFSPIRDTNMPTQVQTSQAGGFENHTVFKIESPMEGMATAQSIFSPIRPTDPWQNNTPLPKWMVDVNEDNLLSPIRDTSQIDKSDRDSPTHQMKTCLTLDVTVSSPDVTDKENIEPLAVVTEEHGSALPPPVTVPSIINTSQKESSSTRKGDYQAPYMTISPNTSSNTKLSPPRKRQLLRPVQASDLAPDTLPAQPETAAAAMDVILGGTAADVPVASHEAPRLQMELVRSCMVDVLEEFQDEFNSRLMHLQYIITKKFIEQQEVMEKLHRQYSLNEDLMKENELLHQQIARLQAKY